MSEEQQYSPLQAGEIIQDGDQFFYDGEWVAYQPHRFGSPLDSAADARRPVVQSDQAADESSTTLAARLQNRLGDAIFCNMNLQVQRDNLQAELEASQRMYMEAMAALEREVMMHRETNRTLDEVCRERDALQEQLQERAGEPRKPEILDFLGVQIAVIPYLQAAVGRDAQRELTIAGRTLQMVRSAIESDRIGRDGESTGDGKEGA